MSPAKTRTQKGRPTGPSWAGSAFVIEAIVLLAFLVASAAVFVQLFSAASLRAEESGTRATAVAAASTVAERFAADPASVQEITQFDDLVAVCKTKATSRAGGVVYYADITIYKHKDEPTEAGEGTSVTAESFADEQASVYSISTSAYVSEASG